MKHHPTPHWRVVQLSTGLPGLERHPVLDVRHGMVHLDPMYAPRGYTRFPEAEWCRTEEEAVQRALVRARETVASARRSLTAAEAYVAALELLGAVKSKDPDTSAALREVFRRRRSEAPEFIDPNQPPEDKKP